MRPLTPLVAFLSACTSEAPDDARRPSPSTPVVGAPLVPTSGTTYQGSVDGAFAIGDADGDGAPNLIVSLGPDEVACGLEDTQPGVFVLGPPFEGGDVRDVATARIDACTPGQSWDRAAVDLPGDLTGDGVLDALVGAGGDHLVCPGPLIGDLVRDDAAAILLGWTSARADADLDGDGSLDLAGSTLGQGAGFTFGPVAGELDAGDFDVRFPSGDPAGVADLDGDGRPNLLWSYGANLQMSLILLEEDLPAEADPWEARQTSFGRLGPLATGDLTGDGAVDPLVRDHLPPNEADPLLDARAHLFVGPFEGDPGQAYATFEGDYQTDRPVSATVADLDGDGVDDLALAWSAGRIAIHLGPIGPGPHAMADAAVVLTGPVLPQVVDTEHGFPGLHGDRFGERLAAADLDGDGLVDLVASTDDGPTVLWGGTLLSR